MVVGFGDVRGVLWFIFVKSFGVIGDEVLFILCKVFC